MKTQISVFTNEKNTWYTISQYDRKTKQYKSVNIPNELGLLILELYACTLYKDGGWYKIYNL